MVNKFLRIFLFGFFVLGVGFFVNANVSQAAYCASSCNYGEASPSLCSAENSCNEGDLCCNNESFPQASTKADTVTSSSGNGCAGKSDGAACVFEISGDFGICYQGDCKLGSSTPPPATTCSSIVSYEQGCNGTSPTCAPPCVVNSGCACRKPGGSEDTPGAGGIVGSGGLTYPTTGLADPAGGIKQILTTFLQWILGIFGILALISFILSGSMYLLASGSDDMIKRAKTTMEFSIIGVIVGLSGFILIRAIDGALNATGLGM